MVPAFSSRWIVKKELQRDRDKSLKAYNLDVPIFKTETVRIYDREVTAATLSGSNRITSCKAGKVKSFTVDMNVEICL